MEANRNVKLLKAIVHINRALACVEAELSPQNVGSSAVNFVKEELKLEQELQWKRNQVHVFS